MTVRTATRRLLNVLFSLALLATVVACGDNKPPPKVAQLTPGSMPADATWTGVYYSPLYGYLHVVQEGNVVNARWERPLKDKWGKLQGNADGTVLRFDWNEYTVGLVGPNSKKNGKGYFVYRRPEGDNVDDVIAGETGRGADELGRPWEAIKQRNVKPQLESIGGTGASDIGGGDWDDPNREPDTEPEAPAEAEGGDDDADAADAPTLDPELR